MISAEEAFKRSELNKKELTVLIVDRYSEELLSRLDYSLNVAISLGHTYFTRSINKRYVQKERWFRKPTLNDLGKKVLSEFIEAGYELKIRRNSFDFDYYLEVSWKKKSNSLMLYTG